MRQTITADDVMAEISPQQLLAKTLADLANDWHAHLKGQGQVQ
jgi:hypothetical protein